MTSSILCLLRGEPAALKSRSSLSLAATPLPRSRPLNLCAKRDRGLPPSSAESSPGKSNENLIGVIGCCCGSRLRLGVMMGDDSAMVTMRWMREYDEVWDVWLMGYQIWYWRKRQLKRSHIHEVISQATVV